MQISDEWNSIIEIPTKQKEYDKSFYGSNIGDLFIRDNNMIHVT
jgi:hypothetical protein